MNKIVIIGGGGHARVVISIIRQLEGYEIVGYIDIKNNGDLLGVRYAGSDVLLEKLYSEKKAGHAAMGIGVAASLQKRKELLGKAASIGFRFPPIISPHCVIGEEVGIGEGTIVMNGTVINTGTVIGKHCIINTGSVVDHDCRIGDFVHIAPGATLCGGVEIGENAFVGSGATIIPGREIGRNAVIGAGAVVTGDCLQEGTYIGVPAKLSGS
jgi:sugar O-acyltransferase (sialic acid O-acetyltransferase NeuD family)